jgi:predicted ribosome quality control (RQC) complex YloA/Tae2 family protein
MPNDALTLGYIAGELNRLLTGGRIDRVSMPEADEILLGVYSGGVNYKLDICVNPNNPHINITSAAKPNPAAAPSFCMHLRKHISGGNITGVTQLLCERVINIHIRARNELMDTVCCTLACELMTRYANIILLDGDGIISDSIRHISLDISSKRQLLPNLRYEIPLQQTKLIYSDPGLTAALTAFTGGRLDGYIASIMQGLAPVSISEALFRAGVPADCGAVTAEDAKKITAALIGLHENPASPCAQFDGDAVTDFFASRCGHLDCALREYATVNAAADAYFCNKDRLTRLSARTRAVNQTVKSAVSRAEKKLALLTEKERDCAGLDKHRLFGELLTANLYKIPLKADKITVDNYYDGTQVGIKLDPSLTPSRNAAAYFKRYNKQKKSLEYLIPQIKALREELDYLFSVRESIRLSAEITALDEIEHELSLSGLQKSKTRKAAQPGKNKVRTPPEAEPLKTESDGFVILIGRNNLLNDRLTFKTAAPADLWFHVKDAHGAHVIVVTAGKKVPVSVLLRAAELAAYYSEAHAAGKTPVDYTEKRHLKKLSRPGLVTYADYKTILAEPKGL